MDWPLVALGVFALFFFSNPQRHCDHGPDDTQVLVRVGDRVSAGESPLAILGRTAES